MPAGQPYTRRFIQVRGLAAGHSSQYRVPGDKLAVVRSFSGLLYGSEFGDVAQLIGSLGETVAQAQKAAYESFGSFVAGEGFAIELRAVYHGLDYITVGCGAGTIDAQVSGYLFSWNPEEE